MLCDTNRDPVESRRSQEPGYCTTGRERERGCLPCMARNLCDSNKDSLQEPTISMQPTSHL
jgi:hypothetical protein